MRQWSLHLQKPGLSGARMQKAILPHLNLWLDRKFGRMEFRLTQVLTGHGCFGSYLYRIQKVASPACEYCDSAAEDTVHTVQVCPAWRGEREVLSRSVGSCLDLGTMIKTSLESREAWLAMAAFAEKVMREKERRERERQRLERERSNGSEISFSSPETTDESASSSSEEE